MIEVYSRDLKKLAVLENAYGAVEKQPLNDVGELMLSLPWDDPKRETITPNAFLRSEEGIFYRVLSDSVKRSDTHTVEISAEHAIATLVDDIMFRTHILGGTDYTTREVIEYILLRQTQKRWQLAGCDFEKMFEYGFESENLLNALFSIANLFVEGYRWEYDFSVYPWRVSLREIKETARPDFYIRAGKNLLTEENTRSTEQLCTRLYLLGYGEGDNQLTISAINGGKPYLESPKEVIDRHGLISKVYVDRQFEDAQSLMERGRALLLEMQEPQYTRKFSAADLLEITNDDLDRAQPGGLCRLEDGTNAFITSVTRRLDEPGNMEIELSTTAKDIAKSVADMADRQRIEQVYSQGATQIYSQSIQANADSKTQAVLNFFIPGEMRIVNRVAAKISLDSFRTYSRTTTGGGGSTSTSSAGGGGATTSASSGGSTNTSTSGGGVTLTEAQKVTTTLASTGAPLDSASGESMLYTNSNTAGLDTYSGGAVTTGGASNTTTSSPSNTYTDSTGTNTGSAMAEPNVLHAHSVNSHQHQHNHYHTMSHYHTGGSHTHGIAPHAHYMRHYHSVTATVTIPGFQLVVPNHTHSVSTPSHTHSVTLSTHSHSVDIPSHSHSLEHGIYRTGSPTGAGIYVNGTHKGDMAKEREIDLTQYLLGSDGKIPRGSWIKLGILPNDLSYVTIDLYVQGFVQSRGGGAY